MRLTAGLTRAVVALAAMAALALPATAPSQADPGAPPPPQGEDGPAGLFLDGRSTGARTGDLPPQDPIMPVPEGLAGFVPPSGTIHPRLESGLSQLVAAQQQGADAARLALYRGIPLLHDGLTVIAETDPADAPRVAAEARALGLEVQGVHEGWVQVRAPLDRLLHLSQTPGVRFVRRPVQFIGQAITSEAVGKVGVRPWHDAGFRGQGARIAVIDQGFLGLRARVDSGELPANVITRSFIAGLDDVDRRSRHGTACAELVYDMAPASQLYLVAISTEVELAQAVQWLIEEQVDIISFSLGAPAAPLDGSGGLDRIVDQARAAGILWFNAAGNYGAGHWTGPFVDDGEGWHAFAPGQRLLPVEIGPDESAGFMLTWDGWPTTAEDFGFYLFWRGIDGSLQLMGFSDSGQTGDQPPTEFIVAFGPPRGTHYLAIRRQGGSAPVRFHIYSLAQDLGAGVPDGSVISPATARGAVAVGATNGFDQVQAYSSRGPTADGRLKPDLVAPDTVTTESYGHLGFPGTSASAPHAAGLAGVVLSAYPELGRDGLLAWLQREAVPLGAVGPTNVWGVGRVQLPLVPQVTPAAPTATPSPTPTAAGSPTVTPTGTRTPTPTRTATPTRPPGTPTASPTPAFTATGVAWPSASRYLPVVYRGAR